MNLPPKVLATMIAVSSPRRSFRWWQMSLRTLFVLTAVFAVAAWFWEPLAVMAQSAWEIWFPSQPPPHACGPCGMG
jgi:hypothetical protein